MSSDQRARLKQWIESGEAQLYPLTFPQRELWDASPLPVTDAANHICCLIKVRGLLTERDCREAVQRVTELQEVLRLSFLPGKDRPLQMIRKNCEANVVFRELAPADRRPEKIDELVIEIFSEPFDLVQGPLYRLVDLRRTADDHVLAFAIHHAIADGWSLGVFMQDLFAAYVQELLGAPEALPSVPLSYTMWGASERAFWQPALLEQRAAFWKSNLAATRRMWSAPITPGTPRRWLSKIPAAPASEIQELARRNGATLFSTLLGAFQIAFSKWTGADDVLVAAPVANRSKQTVRETMGYYASIVPLRGQVDRTRIVSDHLRAVHQMTIDSFANAMPFVEMARALDEHPTPGRNPLFEVRFALQNHPMPEVAAPNLSARLNMRSTGTPRFQVGCEITEDSAGSEVAWLFRENLFSQRDIEDLDGIFQRVLAGICRSPEGRISKLLN
jgi:non-ribosomal peptide synthetase component F